MTTEPKLRAFSVLEREEMTGEIYFAEHDITARRWGAADHACGDIAGVECRRAPWADEFAEQGAIPAAAAVANGWHFECGYCGERIDEDSLADRRLAVSGVIGTMRSLVFCCKTHELRFRRDCRRSRLAEDAMIDVLRGMVLRRFPDAVVADTREGKTHMRNHAYSPGGVVVEQAVVAFDFPGRKHWPASLRLDASYRDQLPSIPHYSCSYGDLETFNAWADAHDGRPSANDNEPIEVAA